MPLQPFVDGLQPLCFIVRRLEQTILPFLESGQPRVHLSEKQIDRREPSQLALLREVLLFERIDANAQGFELRRPARFDHADAALQRRAPNNRTDQLGGEESGERAVCSPP
jgi:hypothetical protein